MTDAFNWHDMPDDKFVRLAETQIWLSAFAANNPRAPAHKQADAACDEARRRGKPWLYQRAWNAAYRSAGHEPSDAQIEAAEDPNEGTAA